MFPVFPLPFVVFPVVVGVYVVVVVVVVVVAVVVNDDDGDDGDDGGDDDGDDDIVFLSSCRCADYCFNASFYIYLLFIYLFIVSRFPSFYHAFVVEVFRCVYCLMRAYKNSEIDMKKMRVNVGDGNYSKHMQKKEPDPQKYADGIHTHKNY